MTPTLPCTTIRLTFTVKVIAFKTTSAVAIGVPMNWSTVDHGCALDIAWKGIADPAVLLATIKLISSRAAHIS